MIDNTSPDFFRILRAEQRDFLTLLRQTRFETLRAGISHAQIISFATYAPWFDDAGFVALYEQVKSATLVDIYRCYELFRLAGQCAALPGKTLHLFDTFSGVAKCDTRFDMLYTGGKHADTDESVVLDLLATLDARAETHRGLFPDDTLDGLPEQLCFAHIDVDASHSVKQSFEALWPRVQPRGIVVFDDYGMFGCEGATLAANEIIAAHRDGLFVHNLNGHALFIKQAAA